MEEELEKEARQSYLDNTDHMQWDAEGDFDYIRGYINAAEPREKRIEKLEKENKKIFNDWLEACDKYGKVSLEQQKNKEQLEWAKEIIREFMKYEINEYDGSLEIHFEELKKQAEQFLQEIGND